MAKTKTKVVTLKRKRMKMRNNQVAENFQNSFQTTQKTFATTYLKQVQRKLEDHNRDKKKRKR